MTIALSVTVYGLDFYEDYKIYANNLRTNQMLRERMENTETAETVKETEESEEHAAPETNYTDYAEHEEPHPGLIEIDGEFYFGILSIPALNLELPVNDVWSDENLNVSPCRYSGGFGGALVICAHDYRFHFANISNLSAGDKAVITDALGGEHIYTAELTEVIAGTDIEGMINTTYGLTLFTCTSAGKDRVAVRFAKI